MALALNNPGRFIPIQAKKLIYRSLGRSMVSDEGQITKILGNITQENCSAAYCRKIVRHMRPVGSVFKRTDITQLLSSKSLRLFWQWWQIFRSYILFIFSFFLSFWKVLVFLHWNTSTATFFAWQFFKSHRYIC